jgi:hypothetical protein
VLEQKKNGTARGQRPVQISRVGNVLPIAMQKCVLTYERSAHITTEMAFVPVSGQLMYPGGPDT